MSNSDTFVVPEPSLCLVFIELSGVAAKTKLEKPASEHPKVTFRVLQATAEIRWGPELMSQH
jgi:hypothetical protein